MIRAWYNRPKVHFRSTPPRLIVAGMCLVAILAAFGLKTLIERVSLALHDSAGHQLSYQASESWEAEWNIFEDLVVQAARPSSIPRNQTSQTKITNNVTLHQPPTLLEQRLMSVVENHPHLRFGMKVVLPDQQLSAGVNNQEQFAAASTMKLVVAAAVLDQVDQGKLSLDQVIEGKRLKDWLRLLIQRSDNDAWMYLSKLIGLENEQRYANQQGWDEVRILGNQLSADDLADMLQKLAANQLLSAQSTDLLLSWMQQTNEERLLPAAMQPYTVYHKYGWYQGYVHDAAIITNHPLSPIIIVVMTSGDTSFEQRTSVFQEIGQTVQSGLWL